MPNDHISETTSTPRRRRLRGRWAVLAVVAVVVVAAVVIAVWALRDDRGDFERAVAMAPDDTLRFSWTDWAGVRQDLNSAVDADAAWSDVDDFLSQGHAADLTSVSVLAGSAQPLHEHFGISPASVSWELFAQSRKAAILTVGLPESTSFDRLADAMRELGYREPESDTGLWRASADLATEVGFAPELIFVVLDEERRVVVASNTVEGTESAHEAVVDESDPPEGVADAAAALADEDDPVSAVVYDGEFTCGELSMARTDPVDQDTAEQLVTAAGEVHPLSGFAMGLMSRRDMRVTMAFESDDDARTDADTRSELASGPAPGQGGEFSERFRLGEVSATGRVVSMEMKVVEGSYAFSDLATGPLLFATC